MARKKLSVALQVVQGGFVPGDALSRAILRQSGLGKGNIVVADLNVPRKPAFYRLAHRFGALCRDNIPKFSRIPPHDVLKQLQLESGIGCDEAMVRLGDIWDTLCYELGGQLGDEALDAFRELGAGMEDIEVPARVPKSLAFGEMSEDEFRSVFQGVCGHVADRYWPTLRPDQIAKMAASMPSHEA